MTPEDRLASFLEADGPALAGAAELRRRLAASDTWQEPPEGLGDLIVADIQRERSARPGIPERGRRTGAALRWGAAVAVAAALVAGVVVAAVPHVDAQITLAGTERAPGAAATAALRSTDSGVAITLDITRLAAPPAGFYYQAWVTGDRGMVAIGTFHLRGGPDAVELWSAVSITDYPTITVTLEPEDGNPASSGAVVLTNGSGGG